MAIKYTRWPLYIYILNGHNRYVPTFSIPRTSKITKIGIFGLKICIPSGNPGRNEFTVGDVHLIFNVLEHFSTGRWRFDWNKPEEMWPDEFVKKCLYSSPANVLPKSMHNLYREKGALTIW
jgi:hypothetical protein